MDPTSRWRAVRTADGSFTLASPDHGETCHSLAGAWTQARERYARPCRLRERALGGARTLAVLDIGTGLGLNLAAALAEVEGTGAALDVLSLELEPEVVRAGLGLDCADGELARALEPVRRSLAAALDADGGTFELGAGRVRVVFGDARRTLPLEASPREFDAVFLDPFSPRVAPDLWENEFLAAVARRMAPGSVLSTYSSAVRVRVALLQAGLTVGLGPRVGTKSSGTLAARGAPIPPFDPRTARKLARKAFPGPNPPPGAESARPFS
jgi:tRNA U34 5-methylaminomethyl-2-thiouridine-forming methyltransferase MnmC